MSEPRSYPSPNGAHMAASAAGLYAHPNGTMSPPQAVDPRLSLHGDQALEHELSAQLRGVVGSLTATRGPSTPDGVRVHQPVQSQSTPQQMALNAMDMAQVPNHIPDDGHQSKRSKISRACDECRRKKIRCDAASENGPEACTNCRRTSAPCQFSRQPMKRGPSKGYIKELADRLARLEHDQHQQPIQFPHIGHIDSQDPELLNYLQAIFEQGIADSSNTSDIPGAHRTNERKSTHPIFESLDDRPLSFMPPWPTGAENLDTQHAQGTDGMPLTSAQSAHAAVNDYYRAIQKDHPILQRDVGNLDASLERCGSHLRAAFLGAMDCAVRAWPSTSLEMEPDHLNRCLKTYQIVSCLAGIHGKPRGIIVIQSFILLIIEADIRGPPRSKEFAGPSSWSLKGMCITQAIKIALNLHFDKPVSRNAGRNIDPDDDDALGRRLLAVLFVFDQLHALATATRPCLTAEHYTLTRDDIAILGPVMFGLVWIYKLVGGFAEFYRIIESFPRLENHAMGLSSPLDDMIKAAACPYRISLSLLPETMPIRSHPLIALSCIHAHLLQSHIFMMRHTPGSEVLEILPDVCAMIHNLRKYQVTMTPPYHHFAALAALTLGELAERDTTRNEALRLLTELEGVLRHGQPAGDIGWGANILEFVAKKRAWADMDDASRTTLEQLADAAVRKRKRRNNTDLGTSSFSFSLPAGCSATTMPDAHDENYGGGIDNAAAAAPIATAHLHFKPGSLISDGYLNVLEQVLNQQPHHRALSTGDLRTEGPGGFGG